MMRQLIYSFVAILFFYQSSPVGAVVGEQAFIEDLGRRAIESLTRPGVSKSELESSFRSLLEEGFDVNAIAHFVMGRYWKAMSPEQQSRFIPLFENRLVKSYANRFQEYKGVNFVVRDTRSDGRYVIVSTTIQKPGGPPTPVDWRVRGRKIHDVKVEGVSMSITIRDEYNALVQRNNGNIETFLSQLS